MSLQVSFRVVGLYCYFQNLNLENVSPGSTVQEVMDAIKAVEPSFDYSAVNLGEKSIVDTISYDFGSSSTTPFNSSGRPQDGPRDLSNTIADTSVVWQYYRSVTGSINGSVCELKLFSQGQPSFAIQPLDSNDEFFGRIPEGFNLSTYNLTWRLVTIQMAAENQAKFIAARSKSIKNKKA